MKKLTPNQEIVLKAIKKNDGYITYREISKLFGSKVPALGQYYIRTLIRKGYITRQPFRFIVK